MCLHVVKTSKKTYSGDFYKKRSEMKIVLGEAQNKKQTYLFCFVSGGVRSLIFRDSPKT